MGYEPGYGYITSGHKIRLGYCGNNFNCGLNPWEARSLDAKLDDGLPLSGRIVIGVQIGGYSFLHPVTGPGYAYCNNEATNQYLNENNLFIYLGQPVYRGCPLIISAQF